jgi:hypothetical protein
VILRLVGRHKFFLSLVPPFLLFASCLAIPLLAAEPITAGLQAPHHHHQGGLNSWEGSAVGKAYSEFNHHLAGLFVVVIGLAELIPALGLVGSRMKERGRRALRWIGFLLPAALLLTGLFLIIWSDHEGWPIGSRTLVQTYFGDDWEMIQHKLFGITLLAVGMVENFRRSGWLQHPGWRLPLPGLAIVGGVSLFLHSHGAHPAAHQIAMHHAVMGAMAVTAGTSKIASIWQRTSKLGRWEMLWGTLVLLIGLQLLIYSE